MTPHDHRTYVPGCYRCELGRDEEADHQANKCPRCDGDGYTSSGEDCFRCGGSGRRDA